MNEDQLEQLNFERFQDNGWLLPNLLSGELNVSN